MRALFDQATFWDAESSLWWPFVSDIKQETDSNAVSSACQASSKKIGQNNKPTTITQPLYMSVSLKCTLRGCYLFIMHWCYVIPWWMLKCPSPLTNTISFLLAYTTTNCYATEEVNASMDLWNHHLTSETEASNTEAAFKINWPWK